MEKKLTVTQIFKADNNTKLKIPMFTCGVSAGFPSPADDFIDKKLDLNEFLIKHPSATFLVRVEGQSMINAGIFSGDILIVDRSIEVSNNDIVVAFINGEFTVKRIGTKKGKYYLLPENEDYKPIEVTPDMNFEVWGVVTYVIHKPA